VHTRNYIPRQTAFCADWLLFREDELAAQFLTAFPRFQIPHRLEKLQQDRQTIATRMEERFVVEGSILASIQSNNGGQSRIGSLSSMTS